MSTFQRYSSTRQNITHRVTEWVRFNLINQVRCIMFTFKIDIVPIRREIVLNIILCLCALLIHLKIILWWSNLRYSWELEIQIWPQFYVKPCKSLKLDLGRPKQMSNSSNIRTSVIGCQHDVHLKLFRYYLWNK